MTPMKSTIDWNEIVPRLDKGLRDTLYLEAVTMLSAAAPRMAHVNGRKPRTPGNSRVYKGARLWGEVGDGRPLNLKGRRYVINKKAENPPARGKIGAVWKLLIESKADSITYEGLVSVCKGQKAQWHSMICQLWERHFIDVMPERKFIEAIPGK